ncbi:MAG: hypothetical protein Q9227_003495 [Pyrenula ochraceoflavens]
MCNSNVPRKRCGSDVPTVETTTYFEKRGRSLSDSSNCGTSIGDFRTLDPISLGSLDYIYQDLDTFSLQIRVLSIIPTSNRSAPVHCKIDLVSLAESPNFTALSYVWGDAKEKNLIYVDGRQFFVTANLYGALLHLRSSNKCQNLWIDAICINQANEKEKTNQVLHMRNIYAQAAIVLIWFGTGDDEVAKTAAFFSEKDKTGRSGLTSFVFALEDGDEDRIAALPGLEKLLQNPWFTRMWVVQELVVAKKIPLVGCGDTWFSWKNLTSIINERMADEIYRREHSAHLVSFAFLRQNFNFDVGIDDFVSLLLATSDRESSEPRDKIFALLGLASDRIRTSITPDYTAPITVIFQQAMAVTLKAAEDLELLRAAAIGDRNSELSVPSWCVDFSKTNWSHRLCELGDFSLRGPIGSAYGDKARSSIGFDSEMQSLTIQGAIIGTVTHVASIEVVSQIHQLQETRVEAVPLEELIGVYCQKFIADVFTFSLVALQTLSIRLGDESAIEVLRTGDIWKVLTRNQFTDWFFELYWYRDHAWPDHDDCSIFETFAEQWYPSNDIPWANHAPESGSITQFHEPERVKDQFAGLVLETMKYIAGRGFICTDTGYIANSLPGVRENDQLCILFGCHEPAVLRPCGVGKPPQQVFEPVAFAWTHGVMDGEFVEKEDFEERSFTLV